MAEEKEPVEKQPDEEVLDAKALKEEVERLRAENEEQTNNARYWHGELQKRNAAAPTPAAKQAEAEPEEEIDPIETLSKDGIKGLDAILEKRGYVRAADVDKKIETRAQTIAAEARIATEYPDLKDPNSDFFKATAVHYRSMVEAGVSPNLAMQFAAEKAELEGYKAGKRLPKAEREEREARAKAQAGDKGKAASERTEESGELDAFQKSICAAMDITEEQYMKRAKGGVVVTNK